MCKYGAGRVRAELGCIIILNLESSGLNSLYQLFSSVISTHPVH